MSNRSQNEIQSMLLDKLYAELIDNPGPVGYGLNKEQLKERLNISEKVFEDIIWRLQRDEKVTPCRGFFTNCLYIIDEKGIEEVNRKNNNSFEQAIGEACKAIERSALKSNQKDEINKQIKKLQEQFEKINDRQQPDKIQLDKSLNFLKKNAHYIKELLELVDIITRICGH